MIPVLYGSVEIAYADANGYLYLDNDGNVFTRTERLEDYATLGSGALGDLISCVVTEERNGKYELFATYPVSGRRYSDIVEGAVIKATPSKGRDPDYFRIYSITKPISGIIEIRAEHISYQLSHIPVMPFTAGSCSAALLGLKSHSAEPNPFTFWTDKATVATYMQTVPASCRSRLGGVQGSILDVYGGEWEFDRLDVKLLASRGADRGVQLRYGKNITDLTQETNIANTITGICPYWADDDGNVVTLPENVISSPKANLFPYRRTVVKDFSQAWQDKPTVDQLRAKAQAYVEGADIGVPKVSIKVKFVDLSQTDDYADIALLETVKLCDTVTVIFEPFDINVKSKVVKTEWNALKDRYDSVTLGTVSTNLAGIVAQSEKDTAQSIEDTRSILANEISHATDQITGSDGGYVVINRDADGNPFELLVMNTPSINTAMRVWRWNQDGLGVSNNGYAGPYETAMTADGHFVANFITAGTLVANLIKAGVLSSTNGDYYLDMDTGVVTMAKANITGGGIDITGSSYDAPIINLRFGGTYHNIVSPAEMKIESSDGYAEYGAHRYIITQTINGETTIGNFGAGEFEVSLNTTGSIGGRTYPSPELEIRDSSMNELVSLKEGELRFYDGSTGRTRIKLDYTGLYFYNSSGALTNSYLA